MNVIVYADGASRGNPGPAAIGVSVCDSKGKELATVSKAIGTATNNLAEYQAQSRGSARLRSWVLLGSSCGWIASWWYANSSVHTALRRHNSNHYIRARCSWRAPSTPSRSATCQGNRTPAPML